MNIREKIARWLPENDLGRDLRARSVKLLSYPLDFLLRWRGSVKFLRRAGRSRELPRNEGRS